MVTLLAVSIAGAIVGYLYGYAMYDSPVIGAGIGASITSCIALFERFFVKQSWGKWLRRSPFIVFVVVSASVWLVFITLSLYIVPILLGTMPETALLRPSDAAFTTDLLFSAVASLVLNTGMRLRSLVGGRVLLNFLSGRYRNPIAEERIFLFLDLIGSTAIAERLGPVKYHSFLRDFIEAIEESISEFGGEIYQYVGDEVVATWPVRSKRSNARAVACHFEMVRAIEKRRNYFIKKYDALPTFGTGIHCGEVVAGEIGDQRRQIVYVGDAVNTAARIEAQARAHGRGLMLSETLLSKVDLPAGVTVKELGMIALKGKVEPVELYEAFDSDTEISASI